MTEEDFYPRSPCGERPVRVYASRHGHLISIHALLAESDLYDTYAKVLRVNISIHALLAESDWPDAKRTSILYYFYPRSPCGERLMGASQGALAGHISIHALLAESDLVNGDAPSSCFVNFYPRSPCGERLSSKL